MRRPALVKPALVPTLIGGLAFVMVAGLTFLACSGSQNRPNDEYWSTEHAEETRPLRETEELNAAGPPSSDAGSEALLGVRHDVVIAPSVPRDARCSCLAVVVGDPRDPKFEWQNGAPEVGPG